MRTIFFLCACQFGLNATIASAQMLYNPQPTYGQLQNLWTLGAMQSFGSRGVQTGVSNPMINGYGPQQVGDPTAPTTPATKSSTNKSGSKKRTLADIKAAVRAKDEARRAANKKSTKKTSTSPVTSTAK
jgi:hypothetical protein